MTAIYATFGTETPGTREVKDRGKASRAFPCCAQRGPYLVHAWKPTQDWDPDYTVAECQSCGATLTVGDYAGMYECPPRGFMAT